MSAAETQKETVREVSRGMGRGGGANTSLPAGGPGLDGVVDVVWLWVASLPFVAGCSRSL